ncbi:methyltransferase domain-containing protein [Nocardioides sp. dk4132]|uniref:class I SAM-dependent methyltransferase n=1 Tax=unclassified Nocardioides TaxID=2615069 RepID=UPI001295D114|nr:MULTISPECIES: class I SAM-dependent methyltransferase [unclassified Nocardioides]MQW75306.1 methyltransferase domain-containing protein [Nocardioides sp. dk4132]QGA07544.1 methyltransferase domain-containing protein [Nocardioides sp. dk884]
MADPVDTSRVADYDDFGAEYSARNANSLFNAYYERPEMLRLAGDVAGLRVLDAGCGSGPLTEALRDKGAVVSGFDLSPVMVDLARERLGEDADVRVADLGAPLPYPDDAFDLVVSSLALHYVEDWDAALAEVRRVLRPGGRLTVSIIHPTVYVVGYPDADYFALTQYSEDYDYGDRTVWMTYWHRPLQDVLNAFIGAGFTIKAVTEPPPAADTPPELVADLDGRSFICFLFVDLEAA